MPTPVLILLILGALISTINVYTSFIRYPLHRLRGRSAESFKFVSGYPLFGSLFLWIAAPFLWNNPALFWPIIALSLLDTGGIHWFAYVMLWTEVIEPRRNRRD